jgi:hypothetical protein
MGKCSGIARRRLARCDWSNTERPNVQIVVLRGLERGHNLLRLDAALSRAFMAGSLNFILYAESDATSLRHRHRRLRPGAGGFPQSCWVEADARPAQHPRSCSRLPLARLHFRLCLDGRRRGDRPRRGQPFFRFFGDGEAAARFDKAIERAKALGGVATDIDFEPFIEVASLLCGAWTAERILAPQIIAVAKLTGAIGSISPLINMHKSPP